VLKVDLFSTQMSVCNVKIQNPDILQSQPHHVSG